MFYSAYVPVVENSLLPSLDTKPPLLRSIACTRRTGSCGFTVFRPPSCWMTPTRTLTHGWTPSATGRCGIWTGSPVEVMRADLETLLRVPGIGPTSARRIVSARRCGGTLRFEDLKKAGRGAETGAVLYYLRRADTGGTALLPPPRCPCSWNDWSAVRCASDQAAQLSLFDPVGEAV